MTRPAITRQCCRVIVRPFRPSEALHIPAILTAHLVQGAGNLAKAAVPDGIDQLGEDVFPMQGRFLQFPQFPGALAAVPLMKISQPPELFILFLVG